MYEFILDVMGSDDPRALVHGAAMAVNAYPDVKLLIPGREDFLRPMLDEEEYDRERIVILPADEVITNDESPTVALQQKKGASVAVGIRHLRENDAVTGMIGAGNTGALLAGATLLLGRVKGVARPALAPVLPTFTGGNVCLVDAGANADCTPEMLQQFALLGRALMQSCYGVEEPRVALVSNGTEDKKGNNLVHGAFPLLKETCPGFVGNMEARDVLSGEYDVLVCDGFTGNVLLKSLEGVLMGTMRYMKGVLAQNLPAGTDPTFIGKSLMQMKASFDFNARGGALFIGVKKPVMKIHGSSNADTVLGAVGQMRNMVAGGFVERVTEAFRA